FVFECEVERHFLAAVSIVQNSRRLARVVVAIVIEKGDRSADLTLEPTGSPDLGQKKSFGEYPAGLLAETDNRVGHVRSGCACWLSGEYQPLQDGRQQEYGSATNRIVPQVADPGGEKEQEHERLRNEGRAENRRAGDVPNEKGNQEQPENAPVNSRPEDVLRFKQ